ncbi:MAG TPA: amidohydrolase family protein [Gemmatimonadaceae bacterium]|nr:amidohydrolase family protein [Gemmatimonadaceae bacterium]
MARTRLLAVPVALSVAGTAAMGQSPGRGFSPTGTYTDYALTNVRIVTAPGKVIERGTVVVRDGRIAAVGASVTVPAGVVRMDLAGNSVYPGLIDAATSVGLPSPTRELAAQTVAQAGAAGGGRGGRGGGAAPGGGRGIPLPNGAAAPPAPPIVLPELDADAEAADMFAPTADQLSAFRTAGVTTVGLVFNGGIFPGRVGAALTGSRNDGRLGLRSSAGQEIAFGTKRGGAYPSVGIGSYAFIRQSILDAQYESRLDKAFKAGTPGGRPANDPFARALMPTATGEMPAWFVASKERELSRVAEITKEMGLKNVVVVGAQEGWKNVDALKRATAVAVVSLEFPAVDSVSGRNFMLYGAGKTGTADDSSLARDVRGNAGALAKAGIPIALASFGGAPGTTFRDRIRMAIAAGLSPDDALKATTVTPAQLLGISAAVGTIEPGKLANLVVVTGNDLFASGNPIKHVFVEGRLY